MSKQKKSSALSRKEIKDRIERNELDLSFNELTEVPVKDLVVFPKVTVLDLSCNLLSELPEQFGDLRQLVQLDLSKNNLVCLPQSFGRLDSLRKLDLYSNRLSSLPLSFSQLTNLKWLDLKNNMLDSELAKVAGTCTAAEDCQRCAKSVLAFMCAVAGKVEREHQERLTRQREAELRQRKLDAERAAELRKQKQREKQERRERHELEVQRRRQQEESSSSNHDLDSSQRHDQSHAVSQQSSQQSGRSCLCYTLVMLTLLLFVSSIGLYLFCSQNTDTCYEWQTKLAHMLN